MAEETVKTAVETDSSGMVALAAGLMIGLAALATGYSQGKIGSSFAATLAERPELKGDMLIYLALPETILILSIVAVFILPK